MQDKHYVSITGIHTTVSVGNRGNKTALVINPASSSTLYDLYALLK